MARQASTVGGWQAVRGGSIILHTRPCRGFTCATRTHAHANAHAQSDRGEPPACATLPFCVGARVFTVVEIDNTNDRRRRRVDGFFSIRSDAILRLDDEFQVTSPLLQILCYSFYSIFSILLLTTTDATDERRRA